MEKNQPFGCRLFLKSLLMVPLFFSTIAGAQIASTDFVIEVNTSNTNGGSTATQARIPTNGGGYSYDVDWDNNGVFEDFAQTGTITHTYGTAGVYTIRIRGAFPRIYFNNSTEKLKITKVVQWGGMGGIAWASFELAFYGCSNMNVTATDAPNLSGVTDLSFMFLTCTMLNADLSSWNVSTITNFTTMFGVATSYTNAGVSLNNWQPSAGTAFTNMFNSTKYNMPLNMWGGAVLNGALDMSGMFASNPEFNQDISSWDVSTVTNFSGMFSSAANYANAGVSLNNWVPIVGTNFSSMFGGCMYNQPLNMWGGATLNGATNMVGMFQLNSVFNQDISSWDVSTITLMNGMFDNASAFNQNINSWNTSNVTNFTNMFRNATAFNQSLTGFEINSATNMGGMLDNSGLSEGNYDNTLINWSTASHLNNVPLGAQNLKFCLSRPERSNLIFNNGWIITGDIQTCSPGGVQTADFTVWLDAAQNVRNGGSPISAGPADAWLNSIARAGSLFTATQAIALQQPTLVANSLNFNPVMRFDGMDDRLTHANQTSGYRNSLGRHLIFLVGRFNGSAAPIFAHEKSTSPDTSGVVTTDGLTIKRGASNENLSYTTPLSGLQLGYFSVVPVGAFSALRNGINNGTATSVVALPSATGNYTVGANQAANQFFQGDIAEIIGYQDAGADINKVQSYLAIKWGLTLAQGTAFNYLNPRNVIVWTGDATMQYNIFGIAKDNISLLNQQISRSEVAGDIIVLSTNNNFTNANGSHTAIALDSAYLIIGNNNASVTTRQVTDMPGSVCGYRPAREWRVQRTIFNQNVSLQANLVSLTDASVALADVFLAIDRDGDGDFTTGTVTMLPATTYNSGVATFEGFQFDTDVSGADVFTIIIKNPGYLPVLVADGATASGVTTNCVDNSSSQPFVNNATFTQKYISIKATTGSLSANVTTGNPVTLSHNTVFTGTTATGSSTRVQLRSTGGVGSAYATALVRRMHTVPSDYDNPASSYTVRIYYDPADVSFANAQALIAAQAIDAAAVSTPGKWFKYEGTASAAATAQVGTSAGFGSGTRTFLTPSASGTETGVSYVEFSGITSFSTFGFMGAAGTIGIVLPITLTRFDATVNNCTVTLKWASATEENFSEYQVQHSSNGVDFGNISIVRGTGSNSQYSFSHQPGNGRAYYRLRSVDLNGNFSFSKVVVITNACNGKRSILLSPNPVLGSSMQLSINGFGSVIKGILYNSIGQQIIAYRLENGSNTLAAGKLATGVYCLLVMDENGGREAIKVMISK